MSNNPLSRLNSSAIALTSAVASTILSSVAWLTQAEAVRELSPLTFMACSGLLCAAFLGLALAAKGTLPKLELVKTHRSDLIKLLLIRYLGAGLIFSYALLLTAGSKVVFLTKVEPYLVMLWAWLLHSHKVRSQHVLLLAIHIGGAIALSTGGQLVFDTDQWGDLLVLLAIALTSLSYLPAQRLALVFGGVQTTFMAQGLSGLLFVIPALLIDPIRNSFSAYSLNGLVNLLATVLLYNIASTVLWYHSLRGVKAWLVSAIRCVGPLVAAPIAWLLLDEPLNSIQIIGAVIVLGTSVLMVKVRDEA